MRVATAAIGLYFGLMVYVDPVASQPAASQPAVPASVAAAPAPSNPAPPASDAAAKHARRTACLQDAKSKKLLGADKTAFLKSCLDGP